MGLIEINWSPDRRQLRSFGLIGAAALTTIGAWVVLRHSFAGAEISATSARTAAWVMWAVAAAMLVLAAALPKWLRWPFVVMTLLAMPIGYVLSYVMMAVLYFGVFTPVGLIFRLIGRDALHRKAQPDQTSYWVRRPAVRDAARYFRQF